MIVSLIDFYTSNLWKEYKVADDLIVYSYIGDHGLICVKGITLFPFSLDVIKDFIDTPSKFGTIESMVEYSNIVEEHPFSTFVCYT